VAAGDEALRVVRRRRGLAGADMAVMSAFESVPSLSTKDPAIARCPPILPDQEALPALSQPRPSCFVAGSRAPRGPAETECDHVLIAMANEGTSWHQFKVLSGAQGFAYSLVPCSCFTALARGTLPTLAVDSRAFWQSKKSVGSMPIHACSLYQYYISGIGVVWAVILRGACKKRPFPLFVVL